VGVGDAVLLHQAQRLLGIEAVHQMHGKAREHRDLEVEGQRGGVIERPGAERTVLAGVDRSRLGNGRAQARHGRAAAVHALRPAGRPRGVEHGPAEHGILERRLVEPRDGVLVGLEARDVPAESKAMGHAGDEVRRLGGNRGVAGVREERLRLAVLDDVGHLGPVEVIVDGGDAEPRARPGIENLGELDPVRAQQSHRVTGPQTALAEQTDELIAARVELPEAALAEGGPEGQALGGHPGVHRDAGPGLGGLLQALAQVCGRARLRHRAPRSSPGRL
jgi:hypothetical protein